MPAREVSGQVGKGDFPEPLEQQRFCFGKRVFERGIHCLLDKALRRFVAVADGKHRGLAQRFVQLAQGDGVQIGMDAPPPRVASVGRNDPCFPQVSHGAPDDDWVGAQALGQGL